MKVNVNNRLGTKVSTKVFRKSGTVISNNEKIHNLITDFGMRQIGVKEMRQIFGGFGTSLRPTCVWGNGSTANSIDSGSITASQSGTAIVATSGFFTLDMEGDLLKYDSGEEVYLQTYVSPTEFTSSDSATIASSEFAVYDVNRTSLDSQVQASSTLNETQTVTVETNIIKATSVFIFSALGSGDTCREIGLIPNGETDLACRVVVPDVSLDSGDQLEITVEFSMTQSYTSPTAIDPTIGEGDWSGQAQVEDIGVLTSEDFMEPSTSAYCKLSSDTAAFGSYGSSVSRSVISSDSMAKTSAPTSPPWTITKQAFYSTSLGNSSNIRTIFISDSSSSSSATAGLVIKLDTPQTKTNLQTLTINVPFTWDRNLSN